MGGSRQSLKRIVALLLSLADLAERASARSRPVLWLVLCFLRPAEAIAQRFVAEMSLSAGLPALSFDDPAPTAADNAIDALRLAMVFRMLASMLDGLIAAGALSGSLRQSCRRAEQRLLACLRDLAWHAPQVVNSS